MNTSNNQTQKSEYDIQAEKFLEKYGLKVNFKLLGCDVPKWEDRGSLHNHYKITISRKGQPGNKLSFQWWDSVNATENNEQPTAYDALTSLSSDSYDYADFAEFCSELGYDADSIKALRIWKEYSKLSKRINQFFTDQEMEDLREIQ